MGAGAAPGISAAVKKASVEEINKVLQNLPEVTRTRLVEALTRTRLGEAFDGSASDADGTGWAPMNNLFAELFAAADTSKDGAVGREELEVFLDAHPEWLEKIDCSKALLFDMLDADHDGGIDSHDRFLWKTAHTLPRPIKSFVVPRKAADDGKTHFILGYGSLLNSESRSGTGKAGEFIYVIAKGFQRGWTYHAKHACKFDGGCFNGVIQTEDPSHEIGGLMFRVPQSDLPAFDLREKTYNRTLVTDMQTLPGPDGKLHELPANAAVWIYVDPAPKHPTTDYPILQTYVDVIVAGALEHSEGFARNVVNTMSGFEYPWKNDRGSGIPSSEGFFPQYKRYSEKSTSQAAIIDQLLQDEVPEQLAKRYLSTGPSGVVLDDGIA